MKSEWYGTMGNGYREQEQGVKRVGGVAGALSHVCIITEAAYINVW